MSRGTLDAVLFDLDGTLADSMTSIAAALVDTLASHGHVTTVEQLMPLFGPSMPAVIQRVVPVDDAEAERLYQAYLPNYYERYLPRTRPIPGADGLLEELAALMPLAVVTSKIEDGARSLLAQLGWAEHFAVVVGRDTSGGIKPSPEPVHHALAALGVDAARAAFVGDTEEDMRAAAAAGVATRVDLTVIRSEQQLRAAGATHACPDLAAVRTQLLAALGARLA